MMTDERLCGECSVCCEVAEIPGFLAAHTVCRYQRRSAVGSCRIAGRPERPELCDSFTCAWLNGIGDEGARPDLVGAMFTVNFTHPGKVIGFVGEQAKGALCGGPAEAMAVAFTRTLAMPLIVVPYGKDNSGEFVILHDNLRLLAVQMIGAEVWRLSDDVAMYERVVPGG
jgi:hypothetical protein